MIDGRPQRTWSQTATCRRLAGALSARGIGDTVAKLLVTADETGQTTLGAAIYMAEEVLQKEARSREQKMTPTQS